MAVGALIIRVGFRLLRGSTYFCFVTLGAFVFGWIATAFYIYGADTIPESRRYAIEFELFLALALAEAFRLSMRNSSSTVRMCAMGTAGVMFLVGAPQLWAYMNQGWRVWLPTPPERSVEYQLGRWISEHPPQGRVFASGGLRFRLNSWFDLQQVGGGFETGLQNRVPVDMAYRIRAGHDPAATLLALKALGAGYIVIHGPKSREYYRDFVRPERVAVALPAVYRIEDDTVYALPARSLAHLVAPSELSAGGDPDGDRVLSRYVAAIEDPARPALHVEWTNPSALEIIGPVPTGLLVSLQVNSDPGWQARQDGREIAVTQDALGFLVLHPAPSPATSVELRYRGTGEQRIMAVLSAATWLVALFALFRRRAKALPRESHAPA
jgi:hypothetical protein